MISQDYRKEISVTPPEKLVPWPYVLLIFAAVGLGIAWFATFEVRTHPKAIPRMDNAAMVAPAARLNSA